MYCDGCHDGISAVRVILRVRGPLPSRMQGIPARPFLTAPRLSLIVVPEAVNDDVPDRAVFGDQHLFGEADPYGIENEPPTPEVIQR